jgi:hypothetical protein
LSQALPTPLFLLLPFVSLSAFDDVDSIQNTSVIVPFSLFACRPPPQIPSLFAPYSSEPCPSCPAQDLPLLAQRFVQVQKFDLPLSVFFGRDVGRCLRRSIVVTRNFASLILYLLTSLSSAISTTILTLETTINPVSRKEFAMSSHPHFSLPVLSLPPLRRPGPKTVPRLVSLPSEMDAWLEEIRAARAYRSVSAVVVELLRDCWERKQSAV